MGNPNSKIKDIEKYLLHAKSAVARNSKALNLPQLERRSDYNNAVAMIDYSHYIQTADYHYFVSRVLFMHHVTDYAFFCAQQCVENYLKAYLKYHNEIPLNTHDLDTLINECRKPPHNLDPFIASDYIEVIAQKFNPFNEIARYPVQRVRPKDGSYMTVHPDDIFVLDYYVYRMRELIPIPKNSWDILSGKHFKLQMCMEHFPDFYATFKKDNMNFGQQ